jgi:hypothetical protein
MGSAKHDIGEDHVVVLRERIGDWPAGTIGTAVTVYVDAALVEGPRTRRPVGRWTWSSSLPISSKRRGAPETARSADGSLMEASTAAVAPANDLQHSCGSSVHGPNPHQTGS